MVIKYILIIFKQVLIETGAGLKANFADNVYQEVGAKVVDSNSVYD